MNVPRLWRLLHTRGSARAADYFEAGSAALDFFQHMGYRHMNLFVWLGFMHSWWNDFVSGGRPQTMNDRLAARVEELGGQIFYKRAVARVLTAGQRDLRVVGVETAKGDVINTPQVIYTGDMKSLYHYLLPQRPEPYPDARTHPARIAFRGADLGIPRFEYSAAGRARLFANAPHLLFSQYAIHDPHEMRGADLHGRAWVEVSARGINPENPHLAPPGHSTLVLQTMVRAAWHDRWQTIGASDKSALRALKQDITAQIVSTLGHLLPGVENQVLCTATWQRVSVFVSTH